MLLDILAGIIFIGSLVGIAVIIGRKFPTLAAIDPAATADPAAERKTSLLEQRLKRKMTSWWGRLASSGQPLLKNVASAGQRLQRRLVDLEHEYKVRSLPVILNRRQRQRVAEEVSTLLAQARTFLDDDELHAAEEKALQVVRLEPRSARAFVFLGELYVHMREFQHAKEVYRYLIKLAEDGDAVSEAGVDADAATSPSQRVRYYLQLAQIERQLEEWDEAFASIQEAIRLEPNHPKVLDELIEISLGYGKKQFAEDAITKVKAKNPDNQKIPEWEKRLSEIV